MISTSAPWAAGHIGEPTRAHRSCLTVMPSSNGSFFDEFPGRDPKGSTPRVEWNNELLLLRLM